MLVPGYRGSFLYDGDERVYLQPKEAFSRGRLQLGTCEAGRLPLDAGGPVTTYTLWPYELDIYGTFMAWGRDHLTAFTAFGYDWRAELPGTAEKLCNFIGDRQADLIAHSMGGLVTMLALQRCPEHIGKVVFAGVPFHGAPGLFDDMFTGSPTSTNTALLSAEALWTFSSTWQLLPRTDDFFVDEQGAPRVVPISDAAVWKHWKQPCPGLLTERLADRAAMPKEFEKVPSRALAIVGKGRKVIAAIKVVGDNDGFDWEHPVTADGDGSVLVTNATPPFEAEKRVTTAEHVQLLNDGAVRAAVETFLKQ